MKLSFCCCSVLLLKLRLTQVFSAKIKFQFNNSQYRLLSLNSAPASSYKGFHRPEIHPRACNFFVNSKHIIRPIIMFWLCPFRGMLPEMFPSQSSLAGLFWYNSRVTGKDLRRTNLWNTNEERKKHNPKGCLSHANWTTAWGLIKK